MRLPSTKDLRAFELTARLGSIKAAADELRISASALSRRIQSLEEELGQTLFIRDARGLTLTETGRSYAEELRTVFHSLEEATTLARKAQRQHLKVVLPSGILSALMRQLESFEQHMPDVDLELHEQVVQIPDDLKMPDADIVFSWGSGHWNGGWISHHINPGCQIAPLCSPMLLKEGRLMSVEELAQQTWIVVSLFEDGWKRWFDALGEPLPKPAKVLKVSSGAMAVEAARQGRGVLMANGFARQPNILICLGWLTPAHAFHAFAPGFGHHLHQRAQNANPAIPLFRQWFFDVVWSPKAREQALTELGKIQTT